MIRLNENHLIPTVLQVYNRLKTYRAHLNEEARLTLVQKKLVKDHGISLTSEDLGKMLAYEKQQPENKPLRRIKKPQFTLDKPIQESFKEQSKFKHEFSFNASKFPRKPLQQKHTQSKPIYERLYDQRKKPCPEVVEFVHSIRESFSRKQPLKTASCISQQPPCKRGRYSHACLDGALSSSVFERLYAERKQLNTKKLTDVQKRELYLKRQREEMRKSRNRLRDSRDTISTKQNCDCGCEDETTISVKSDDFRDGERNTLIFNSTAQDEKFGDQTTAVEFLDTLTERFQERMTLCPID